MRFWRGGLSVWLAWSAGLCAAGPASAGEPAGPPARADAPDHRWLSHVVLDELARCAAPEQWRRLEVELEAAVLARLSCGRLEALGDLNDMVFALRACKYLPLAHRLGGGELAGGLAAHRGLARRLYRALGDVASAEEAIRRFAELWSADRQAVLDSPGLAVAFATSRPSQLHRRQPQAASLVESFRYYTRDGGPFRRDLSKMPYEIARYLADTRLSLAERKWAAAKYRGANPVRSYFRIDYDYPHFRTGKAKRIDSVPYTLANLHRVGGICIDQAYYASEVCKAVGIPATIVHGRGGAGVEHAWFAYCRPSASGAGAKWSSRTGRYREHHYYIGTLRDPASGRTILDAELMLLGSATRLPLWRREQADAATALARRVDRVRDKTDLPDLTALHRLAGTYTRRFDGKGRLPELRVGWIAASRKMDLSLVEDLIAAAVRRNLGHAPAWRLLVEMRKRDRLPVDDLNRFFTTLIDETAGRYPEYSCLLLMQAVPTVPDADRREAVYRRAMGVYAKRPDLRGRLRIALADDYRRGGRKDEALKLYQEVARKHTGLAGIVTKAAGRAERLLLAAGHRGLAIAMYRDLFSRTRRQDVNEIFRAQTSHYQLGSRLAELLEAAGRAAEAKAVLARVQG